MMKQRKQIRLKQYDYSRSGYYYITICAKNRSCIFGNVLNGKMILNDVGKIINGILLMIPKHFNNVKLDIFQIMPNHIHVIIIIKKIFQRNYYEHIIRNENELFKIRQYIKINPFYWENDINHPNE